MGEGKRETVRDKEEEIIEWVKREREMEVLEKEGLEPCCVRG